MKNGALMILNTGQNMTKRKTKSTVNMLLDHNIGMNMNFTQTEK